MKHLKKIKNMSVLAILATTSLLTASGCATMSDSLILGVATGAGAGAIIGNQNGGSGDNVATGAAIGAAVGGLSAYLIHKGLEKRDEGLRRETLLNLEKFDVSAPQRSSQGEVPPGMGHALTRPTVDVEWIETRVDGDKLVEGHKVWRITEKSKWIPGSDKKQEKKNK